MVVSTNPLKFFSTCFSGPFKPLNQTLFLSSLIPCLTGVLQLLQGTFFTHMLSDSLPNTCLVDPTLLSQYRFMASMWLAYVSYLWLVMSNPEKYQVLLHIISSHVLIGGTARTITAIKLGLPIAWLAKVIVIGAIVLEFLLPYLFERFLQEGLQKQEAELVEKDS